jgi:hypothetical protein
MAVHPATPAFADTVFQDNALTPTNCNATEWHWIINGLDEEADAPLSITAHFSGGDEIVPLSNFTGGVAHYSWTDNLSDHLVAPGATAQIFADYTNFNLSHGPCNNNTPTPTPTTPANTPTSTATTPANTPTSTATTPANTPTRTPTQPVGQTALSTSTPPPTSTQPLTSQVQGAQATASPTRPAATSTRAAQVQGAQQLPSTGMGPDESSSKTDYQWLLGAGLLLIGAALTFGSRYISRDNR